MSKLKVRRKVSGKFKFATCHFCAEFYNSHIRQTSGEFVTRESKGKKVRVKGNDIYRFCSVMRCFTLGDNAICSEENFTLTPLFYCRKRTCWLATNITCYASRARKLEGCLRCKQFDQVISQITEKPLDNFYERRSALSPDFNLNTGIPPRNPPENLPEKPKLPRRKSKPISVKMPRRKLKLKRRRDND